MSKTSKSIQDKIAELDRLVAWFDSDDFVLEQAVEKFTQAEKLAGDIDKDLMVIQNDIQVVKERFDTEAM